MNVEPIAIIGRVEKLTALGLDHRPSAGAACKSNRTDCSVLPVRQGAEKQRPGFQTRRVSVDRFQFRLGPEGQEPWPDIYPPGPAKSPMSLCGTPRVMQHFSNRSRKNTIIFNHYYETTNRRHRSMSV